MKKIVLIFIFSITSLLSFEELTHKNFDEKTQKGNIIINFYASWCSICKQADENLVKYSKTKKENIKIYKVDISEQIQLTKRFNADSVPVFVYMKDGKVISQENGIKTVNRIKDCTNKYFD